MERWSKSLVWIPILASIAMIYVYPLALRTPLLDPDEGLHASIAQEMVEHGDYLVPRVDGEPFRDKPILYFAAQAASLRLFGMNEAAVRLPGFLFALLGCATTALLARRMFDAETARCAALAALTLVLPIVLVQSPAHDIALVPWINLLVLSFWEQSQATDTAARWRWTLGMAVCVALSLLTKGLIGIAALSVGIGAYTVVTRTLSPRLVLRCTLALAVGGILASPWFLVMESASPGYLYYYFIERHFLGFVTEGQQHGQAPWHYYLGPVLGGAMPWLIYAVASVLQVWHDDRRSRESRATLLMACWFVGSFAFLCAAGSKLLTYSLPLFPPIAVLAGLGFHRYFEITLARPARWIFSSTFRLCCIFGIFAPFGTLLSIDYCWHAPSPPAAYVVAALASATIAIAFVLFERRQVRLAFAIGMLWFPIGFVAIVTWPMQRLAEQHTQRALEREIANNPTRPESILFVGERIGSFVFYLSPEDREYYRAGRLTHADGYNLHQHLPLPERTLMAVTAKELHTTNCVEKVLALKPIQVGEFYVIEPAASANVADRTTNTKK